MDESKKIQKIEGNTTVKSSFKRNLKQTIDKGSLREQKLDTDKSVRIENVYSKKETGSTSQEVNNTHLQTNSSDTAREFETEKDKTSKRNNSPFSYNIKRIRKRNVEPIYNNNIMDVANKQKTLKDLDEIEKNNVSKGNCKLDIDINTKKNNLLKRIDRRYNNFPNTKGVRVLRTLDERINHKVIVQRVNNKTDKGGTKLSLELRLEERIKDKIDKLNLRNINEPSQQGKINVHSSNSKTIDMKNRQKDRLISKESRSSFRVEGEKTSDIKSLNRIKVTRKGLVDRTKVYSEKRYNQLYNPSLKRQMNTNLSKNIKTNISNTGRLMNEKGKDYITNKLNDEGGTGGRVATSYIRAPERIKEVVKASRFAKDGAGGTGKLVWNGGKVVTTNAYKIGHITKEGIKDLKNGSIKKGIKGLGKNTVQQITSLPEKVVKRVANIVKEGLKQITIKVLPAVGGLCFFIIFISLIFSTFTQVSGLGVEVEVIADSKSIISTRNYLKKMEDEWYVRMKDIKESFLHMKICTVGNNDTVEVVIKNETEDNDVGENTELKTEYLALYCMLAAKYDLKIQNIGVDMGNKQIDTYVDAEVLKQDLKRWFYFLNPITLSEMDVEEKVFWCFPCQHEYRHTTITVCLKTVTDLIVNEGFTDEQILTFNKLYNDLITEGYSGTPLEWKEQGGLGGGSPFDGMSKEVWVEYWENDVPVLNVTRKEFVNMVKNICIPTGKIQYVWGGKNINTGGLDCSGFTKAMYMELGINIGDGSAGQWGKSKAISSNEARPGDLVFKQMPSSSGINHVGIFLGNNNPEGKFGHCAGNSGTIVNSYKGFVFYRRPICKFKDDVKMN